MILGKRRIPGRSFSEGPVLWVLEARDLERDQQYITQGTFACKPFWKKKRNTA